MIRAEPRPFTPAVMAILDRFNRDQLGNAIEVLIAVLDISDGDCDAEEDDPSGQCDEDEVNTEFAMACGGGPGCTISDEGGCEHDGREPDEDIVSCYGLDQTAGVVSNCYGIEHVPVIPCTPLRLSD